MKYPKFIYIFLAIIFFATSCGPEDMGEPLEPIDMIWETILENSISLGGSQYLNFYQDQIITADNYGEEFYSKIFVVNSFDKENGDKKWTFMIDKPNFDRIVYSHVENDLLIIGFFADIHVYDLNTRLLIWENNFEGNNIYGTIPVIHNGRIYRVINNPHQIISFDIETGTSKEHGFLLGEQVHPPAIYEDNEAGSLVLALSRYSEGMKLVAFNDENEIQFEILDVPFFGIAGVHRRAIVVEGDVVYLQGSIVCSAYNLKTNEKLWEYSNGYNDENRLGYTGLKIHNDMIFLNMNEKDITCLDKNTGEVIWINQDQARKCSPEILVNDGYLIFSDNYYDQLNIVNTSDGSLYDSIDLGGGINDNNVIYDENTGRYFSKSSEKIFSFEIR